MTFGVKVVDKIGQKERERKKKELGKSIPSPELVLNDLEPCPTPPPPLKIVISEVL